MAFRFVNTSPESITPDQPPADQDSAMPNPADSPDNVPAENAAKRFRFINRESAPVKKGLGQNIIDSAGAEGRGLMQGATAGFADEAESAIAQGLLKGASYINPQAKQRYQDLFGDQSKMDMYREGRDIARGQDAKAAKENPVAYYGGDVIGSILSPINKLAGVSGGLTKTIGQGALIGGIQGAGRTNTDAIEDPWQAAVDVAASSALGGAASGVLYGVGKGISAAAGKITTMIKGAPDEQTSRAVQIMLDDGKSPQQIMDAVKSSKSSQVPTTVFESAESPTGTALQQVLSGQPSQGGAAMKLFNDARLGTDLPAAIDDTIYKGASTTSTLSAAQNAQKAAGGIIDSTIKARSDAVRPLYEKVASKKIPPALLQSLYDKNPILQKEIAAAANDPVVAQLAGDAPANSIGFLDAVKKSMDGKIGIAMRQGDRTTASAYLQAKNALVGSLDEYSSAYANARAEFEGLSPAITDLKESLVGKIANANDPKQVMSQVMNELPDVIGKARTAFHTNGQGQAWDDLVSSYTGELTDKSTGSVQSLLNKLDGNETVKNRLRAAMGDEAYAGHQMLVNNLRKILPALPTGSNTAEKTQAIEKLMGNTNVSLSDIPTSKIGVLSWIGKKLGRGASDAALAAQNAKNLELARVITSPDMAEYAKALRGLSSRQQIMGTLNWLESRIAGTTAGEATSFSQPLALPAPRPLQITVRPNDANPLPPVDLPQGVPHSSLDNITGAEGTESAAYQDTTGHTTIGQGFNMDSPSAKRVWKMSGIKASFDDARSGKIQLSPEQIGALTSQSYDIALNDARSLLPDFDQQPQNIQDAVVEMSYQLGKPGLTKFKNTLANIKDRNYQQAAQSLLQSRYARQTPQRVKRLAGMLAA